MYKKNRNKQLAFEHFDQPLGLKLNPVLTMCIKLLKVKTGYRY